MSRPQALRLLCFLLLFAWVSFLPLHKAWALRAVLMGVFAFSMLADASVRGRWVSWQDWPMALLLVGYTGSLLAAGNKAAAWPAYIDLAVVLLGAFYFGKGLFMDERLWYRCAQIVAVLAACVAVYGILEAAFSYNPLYEHVFENPYYERYVGIHRPVATQFNSAPLATLLLVTWPFGIVVAQRGGRRDRVLGYTCTTLILICFALCINRSCTLGLIAMVFFWLFVLHRYRALGMAALVFAVLIGTATLLPAPVNRIGLYGILKKNGGLFSRYRMERIEMAWEMFKDSPTCGVGLTHYRLLFDHYYPHPEKLEKIGYEFRIADNMYPSLLGEMGLAGTGGFFLFMGALFYRGLRVYHRSRSARHKTLLLAMLSSLTGVLLGMGGYETFYWTGPYLLFCLLCGCIAGVTCSRMETCVATKPL